MLTNIAFPVFVLSGEAEKQDNILWCTQSDGTMGVVDDYNMKGETIGVRRLQSVSYTHLTLPTKA